MKLETLRCDVAVIGGGPGGIPAAIAAARQGAKVLLVEKNGFLGGNMTIGLPLLGYLDKDGNTIIKGIAQELSQFLGIASLGDNILIANHIGASSHRFLFSHVGFDFISNQFSLSSQVFNHLSQFHQFSNLGHHLISSRTHFSFPPFSCGVA
jgi:hypothetical protein